MLETDQAKQFLLHIKSIFRFKYCSGLSNLPDCDNLTIFGSVKRLTSGAEFIDSLRKLKAASSGVKGTVAWDGFLVNPSHIVKIERI